MESSRNQKILKTIWLTVIFGAAAFCLFKIFFCKGEPTVQPEPTPTEIVDTIDGK